MRPQLYVGVDVSAKSFHAWCKVRGSDKFANDVEGIALFSKWIVSSSTVVVESAGPYHYQLTYQLHEYGIDVATIHPLSVRRFCQMRLQHTKTDRKDAQAIHEFACLAKPTHWRPPSKHLQKLQQMQSSIELMIRQMVAIKNALTTFSHYPNPDRIAYGALEKIMHVQEQQISRLEMKTNSLVQQHYPKAYESLLSIPSIGVKTAVLLLSKTNGLRHFNSSKKLISFVGLAPILYQSGTSVNGRSRISKKGSGDLRRYLYMCALSAIRTNEPCKQVYLRMKEKGKPGRVALIAVCNKLLRQAFSIVKAKGTFSETYKPKSVAKHDKPNRKQLANL